MLIMLRALDRSVLSVYSVELGFKIAHFYHHEQGSKPNPKNDSPEGLNHMTAEAICFAY